MSFMFDPIFWGGLGAMLLIASILIAVCAPQFWPDVFRTAGIGLQRIMEAYRESRRTRFRSDEYRESDSALPEPRSRPREPRLLDRSSQQQRPDRPVVVYVNQDTAPVYESVGCSSGCLTFLVPGLGQLVANRPLSGIFFLIAVPIGYLCLVIPGLILHVIAMLHAAGLQRRIR